MRLKHVYLALCFLGGLLPLRHIVMFIVEQGFDPAEFMRQVYATRVGAFFTADVIASLVALVVFVIAEGARGRVPRYWIAFFGLIVGVSLAFPWFLYLRERHSLSLAISVRNAR